MKWAILEGFTKTASRTLQKIIGNTTVSWEGTFLAAGIVGLVQVVVAAGTATKQKIKLFKDIPGIFGSAMFGILALISTVLGFATFVYGGDIGISTFIITMGIIPGMLIDMIFFKYRSRIREWVGIAIAVFAGWAMLGFPHDTNAGIPLWIWLACANSLAVAINQGITQAVKKVDPMFKNFWGGLASCVGALCILIFIGDNNYIFSSIGINKIWFASALIGCVTVAMWSFNLLSYKTGASIALKKLVMSATYLLSTLILGYFFFEETLTIGKIVAFPLFCIAFILMDKKAWGFVTGK